MAKARQTILLISEDARVLETVRNGLQTRGFSIHTAPGPGEGLISLLKLKPDFVILSVSPLCAASLMTLTDICEADPCTKVIAVSSGTDGGFAMECIRHGAADYIEGPLEIKDIVHSIDRISRKRHLLRIISEPDTDCVHEEDKLLVFGNDIGRLPYIINQAVCNARVVCRDIPMLKTALGEIVLNAIEHGNLGITMEEKAAATSEGEYGKLLEGRMHDPRFAARTVAMHIHMSREELVYTVTDQGKGFDHEALLCSDLRAHGGSGLGLAMARSFFTSIAFNDCGNSVTLVYRRPRAGRRRSRNNAP
ncbi:MAG TPA: ATP-binding protein [Deltaproteobacteria bacterium]|nr:ATP-binding protein [Deltaproteobacteria bacterium]HQJ07900.1 ATP-binding protein [Deltaproteobacteria bacterium]